MSEEKYHQRLISNPVELLQKLIRFDTTNPPGNEAACVAYINNLLQSAGFNPTILEKQAGRPNLITRLKGRGDAPPLLLYGHVDVVTTVGQQWTYPPFDAHVEDEFVWGRGALDMKGGVTMMLAAFLMAKADEIDPAGDIILVILSDEEGAGDNGAKFLVETHPEQFAGVQFAIGEVGGQSRIIGGHRFYPIQVAEKQLCWMEAKVRGPGGHGSRPMKGGTMARLGRLLLQLDGHRLPVHITPVTRFMIESIASSLPQQDAGIFRRLLDPTMTDDVLDGLGNISLFLDPLLHNTVNATIVRGGEKVNVVPSEVTLELDGRLLPGFGPEDMLSELKQFLDDNVEIGVKRYDQGPADPDLRMFDLLADIVQQVDPQGTAIPMLLAGVTDGRYFSQIGIQTYGFTPMKMPEGFHYSELIHAADERIPVDAVGFGAKAIYKVIQRYGSD